MLGRKNNEQPRKGKILKFFGIFMIVFEALGCFFIYFHPRRWSRFIRGEKREIHELSSGQEDFRRFFRDSGNLLKDFFIPHDGNGFKPRILRPKSIFTYAVVAITVKVLVTGFLFFAYPSPAYLSVIISSNMISLSNQSRAAEGLPPLKENVLLSKFAAAKGSDMISRSYFAHDTPEGKRPWQWIDKSAYDYVYAGENLAMDFTSAETVHDAFMKSPTHRRNILNDKYLDIGIAVLSGKIDGHPTILLLEFFGTQRKDLPSLAANRPTTQVTAAKEVKPAQTTKKPLALKPRTAGAAEEPTLPPSSPSVVPPPEADVTSLPSNEAAPENIALAGPSNEGITTVLAQNQSAKSVTGRVIEYSNIFLVAFLIFMLISLALNVFIKFRVQHPSVILQCFALIALLIAMIIFKFHFVENISSELLIL